MSNIKFTTILNRKKQVIDENFDCRGALRIQEIPPGGSSNFFIELYYKIYFFTLIE